MHRILIAAFVSFSHCAFAQEPSPMDSLRSALERGRPNGTVADTAIASTLCLVAKMHINAGELDSSIASTSQAVRVLEAVHAGHGVPAVDRQLMMAYKLSAAAHFYASDYAKSLISAQAMQTVAERLQQPNNIGAAMNYQAYCLRSMELYAKAKSSTWGAIRVLQSVPEGEDMANAYTGLGSIYADERNFDSSSFWLEKALVIYQRTGNAMNAANTILNLADNLNEMDDQEKVVPLLEQARPAILAAAYPPTLAKFHGQMGRALFLRKDLTKALEELSLAEVQARITENDYDLARIQELEALCHAGLGNGIEAVALIKASGDSRSRDLDLAKAQELTEARLAFEQEKKDAVTAALMADERREKMLLYFGAGLLLLIAALLYTLMVKSRKAAKVLAAKNEEITRTQHELVTATKQREAEQVRTRIARDIHDELGGDLTKVALLSTEIARRMERQPQDVPALLQNLGRVSREANAALRDIVWSVDPEQDTWQGLVNHAELYTNRILEGSHLRSELRFDFKGPDTPLDPASKQNIFLVLKEALNNAVKHAQATLVQVRLSTSPAGYTLAVLDNGSGFSEQAGGKEGHGLRNMRSRAQALQAALSLNSTSSGTVLELKGAIPE